MPTSVIEHIRTVAGDGVGLRDGELLGRYVDRRDEAALAALVNRHGPMVWGVCRRQLSHHDAEDAFQATFIVLVRKAASIAQREAVGNWLYGVAHQAALQARRSAARRRAREVQVTEMPDAEAPQDQRADLQPFLDEELSRLPDHYRAVIVLCDLEGRSRKEVAGQFGCPEGTVASRLARARELLARRLAARGVAWSGVAVLSLTAGSAAVPASVVSSTISVASLCAAGQAAIPVKVAALAEGVLKAMLLKKLKPALAVLVVVAMVGLIGYGMAWGQQKGDAVPKPASEPKAPKDAVVKEKAEKKDATAWGKEVDGLQAGLAADSTTCRQGEKLKLTFKLRNVGKAEVTVDCGILSEWAPQVTTNTGRQVTVYVPPPFGGFAIPIKRTLKPGETVTLFNPEVFVESEDRAKVMRETLVNTVTICAAPGKYKIAFDGMIQSHPKLSTGTVEFEVKPASVTAWGKEFSGLQAGLGFRPGEQRAYTHGETVTLVVRVRNVGRENVKFQYLKEFFMEKPPTVTGGEGKTIRLGGVDLLGSIAQIPVDVNLTPGKDMELHDLKIKLAPAGGSGDVTEVSPETLNGKGKFQIQYEQLAAASIDPILSKLATGKLELEVKEAEKQEKEAFTAWGKEAGGLQAGVGFRAGEKRTYRHGETVTFVVRVRNVSKETIAFQYVPAFFNEHPPLVTGVDGKPVRLAGLNAPGKRHPPADVILAPGKEVEIAEWRAALRPASDRDDKPNFEFLYGTGTFGIQYERVLANSSASRVKFDPAVSKLATGKLELEVKEPDKQPQKEEKKSFTAWGKEADGLQAGLAADSSSCRQGEKLKFTVKLRNVGKAEATVTYAVPRDHWPNVTTDNGGQVRVYITQYWNFYGVFIPPIKQTIKLKPGETITLYNPEVEVEPEDRAKLLEEMLVVGTPSICVAPGKYKIVYGVSIQSHANLTTGTVEFEVKPASVTAWGKEYIGLQAGLGFRPGEQRAYTHGETVTLVVRVRTVNKKLLETRLAGRPVEYIPGYFFDWPPSVTDGEGKPVPQIRFPGEGRDHSPKELTLTPGKEVELAELKIELRPESESGNKKENTLYGTGKFQIQYERLMYGSGRLDIGSILRDVATGKLDLEVKSAEKK